MIPLPLWPGTPLFDKDAVFLSCGTWSLMGMELDEPILTDESFKYNYTNEGGRRGQDPLPEKHQRSLDYAEPPEKLV